MQNQDNIQVYYVRPVQAVVDGKPQPKKGVHPVACVALKRLDDGTVARGISICADTDNWCRKDGRNRAIARLRKAAGCKCNGLPIGEPVTVKGAEPEPVMNGEEPVVKNGRVVMALPMEPRRAGINFHMTWAENYGSDALPGYKSAWNPKLTAYETTLLDVAAQRDAEAKARIGAAVAGIAPAVPAPAEPPSCQCCHGCTCPAHDIP